MLYLSNEELSLGENLAAKSIFHLACLPLLVLSSYAYPANLKIVREDGIEYKSAESVSDEAFKRAQFVVQQMTSASREIREKMVAIGFKVEIIGKDQVQSDLPDYSYLRGRKTRDGRDFDTGTRGLGGREMCSIGEENLLCLRNQRYWQEDIFVHEFSHSMMAHMDSDQLRAVEAAYKNEVNKELYPNGIYMIRDSGEYWAEGVQAWLGVTLRTDVNGGFNTRPRPGFPANAGRRESCRRVSEAFRSSRSTRVQRTLSACALGTWARLRPTRRHDESACRVPGFLWVVEGCGCRCARPEASQGGVREVAVVAANLRLPTRTCHPDRLL